MNRRAFLSSIGLAVAAATIDPEKLIWTPARKTIFIPPAAGVGRREAWLQFKQFELNAAEWERWLTPEGLKTTFGFGIPATTSVFDMIERGRQRARELGFL